MKQHIKSIEDLFNLLSLWRGFPNYQLERRADIFFALFLEKILEAYYKDGRKINLKVPEFPLLKARLRKVEDESMGTDKLSVKADYLCIDTTSRKVILLS